MHANPLTRDQFERTLKSTAALNEIKRPATTYWKDAWRRLRSNPVAMVSMGILALIVILAIVIPFVSPYAYDQQDYTAINQGPSAQHWFGTDSLGRDIFVRCWAGARVSLLIALVATCINVIIGVLYGGISGYFGGRVDMIMMRGVEIIYTIPDLLWVIMLMVVMGSGLNTIIIAIAITGWGSMARLVRGQVLQNIRDISDHLRHTAEVRFLQKLCGGADFRGFPGPLSHGKGGGPGDRVPLQRGFNQLDLDLRRPF